MMPEGAAEDRFAAWVLPEVDTLLRAARALTPTPLDAEELVQETMRRAFDRIDEIDRDDPRAWLLAILRHTQADRLRSQMAVPDDHHHARSRLDPRSKDHAVRERFDSAAMGAFTQLPDSLRRTIELVDLAGLSYEEAAEALGISVGMVLSRLRRADHRIRGRLAAAGVAPRPMMKG
jgi:RNA polymerase sigma-70 factor (ECF subfamily)